MEPDIYQTPEFNFGVMVTREDYDQAKNVLFRARIEPKTQFHQGEMAVMGFDNVQSGGAGIPDVTQEEIKDILDKAGIPSVMMDGKEFLKDPVTIDVGDKNKDFRIEEE